MLGTAVTVIALLGIQVAALTEQEMSYNTPMLLPDGLLITGGEEIRSHVATWTVLVTLDAPQEEIGLRQTMENFKSTINRLLKNRDSMNATKTSWYERIMDIEMTMLPDGKGVITRTRRGILDFVGEISQKLFGTATDADVRECKRMIEAVARVSQQVTHSQKALVTVVNQTYHHVQQNRRHIQSLQLFGRTLNREMNFMKTIMEKNHLLIEMLKAELRIDQALSAIEATHNQWLRQLDRYHRQRIALELGWLTEEVLSAPELRQILEAGRRVGLQAPPLPWYYENVSIRPMWEDSARLVFKAELPLISDTHFLRYRLRTWPVPGNESGMVVKLQVPADVAQDTSSGGMFEPSACLGRRPAICRTGPVYDRSSFQCPRGVLTGDEKLRKQCRVTVTRTQQRATVVEEIIPGIYIISTPGESLSLHCVGKDETRIMLIPGVHGVQLAANCRLRGKGWEMAGLIQQSSRVSVRQPILVTPSFDLMDIVPRIPKLLPGMVHEWGELEVIKDIPLDSLVNLPDMSLSPETFGEEHHPVANSLLLGTILMAAGGIALFMYRKGLLPKCPPWEPSGSNDRDEEMTDLPMTGLPSRRQDGQQSASPQLDQPRGMPESIFMLR